MGVFQTGCWALGSRRRQDDRRPLPPATLDVVSLDYEVPDDQDHDDGKDHDGGDHNDEQNRHDDGSFARRNWKKQKIACFNQMVKTSWIEQMHWRMRKSKLS